MIADSHSLARSPTLTSLPPLSGGGGAPPVCPPFRGPSGPSLGRDRRGGGTWGARALAVSRPLPAPSRRPVAPPPRARGPGGERGGGPRCGCAVRRGRSSQGGGGGFLRAGGRAARRPHPLAIWGDPRRRPSRPARVARGPPLAAPSTLPSRPRARRTTPGSAPASHITHSTASAAATSVRCSSFCPCSLCALGLRLPHTVFAHSLTVTASVVRRPSLAAFGCGVPFGCFWLLALALRRAALRCAALLWGRLFWAEARAPVPARLPSAACRPRRAPSPLFSGLSRSVGRSVAAAAAAAPSFSLPKQDRLPPVQCCREGRGARHGRAGSCQQRRAGRGAASPPPPPPRSSPQPRTNGS